MKFNSNSGSARDFLWAAGIENTFVPQTRPGHRALDEYELMGHYEHWREDLSLARDLGLQAMRWGVPWYKVEPEPNKFDWSWTDEVIPFMVEELKILPDHRSDALRLPVLAETRVRQSRIIRSTSPATPPPLPNAIRT